MICKLFSPFSGGELPADLSVNMVCMYVVACDIYIHVQICTPVYTCTHTHTHVLRREL